MRLNKIIDSGSNLIAAKLEQFNPCSSVKDRPASRMIEDAERRGLLMPGATIIEATSGNTGIALAFIAAARGYPLIITMPDSMSVERRNLLKLFGVQLELTPAHLGMKGAIDRALEIKQKTKGSFLVSQFDNRANPAIHEETTAEEIWADTDGKVDIVVCGVGTGGTLTGVGRKLKARKPSVKMIAVEPAASAVLSGASCGAHVIQGIGAGFVPSVLDREMHRCHRQGHQRNGVYFHPRIDPPRRNSGRSLFRRSVGGNGPISQGSSGDPVFLYRPHFPGFRRALQQPSRICERITP